MSARHLLAGALLIGAVGCNKPPVGGAVSIAPTEPFSSDSLQLVVEEEFTDPNGDVLDYRILWSRDGDAMPDYDGARTIPATATRRGETWSVQVAADDGRVLGGIREASVTVLNAPPRVDSIDISPISAVTSDVLTAAVLASDPDGDATNVTITWEIDGRPAGEGTTLAAFSAARGQEVVAIANVDDGSLPGPEKRSSTVIIANSPPSISAVTISPDTDIEPDTELGCFVSGWSDDDLDAPGYTYEWLIDGAVVGRTETLVSGKSPGDVVTCRVTPDDGFTTGEPLTSGPVTVGESITPTCEPTVAMPAEPYSGADLQPYQVQVSGVYAYDRSTNQARGWCDPVDGEQPLAIDLLIYDSRYESTGDLRYVCGMRLVSTAPAVAAGSHSFSFDLGSGSTSYDHFGFTLASGSFRAEDRRFDTSSGTIGGCLVRRWDSATWGSDVAGLFEDQDWGLYTGDLADEVVDILADSDDPFDDEDAWSLYESGYLFGGSSMTSDTVGTGPIHYALAFEADELWGPSLDSDDALIRITASRAVPSAGRPASGLYSLSSVYVWYADSLLLP